METVTIKVKPETAHRWRTIAQREGLDLEAVAAQAAEAGTDALESVREYSQSQEKRRPLLDSIEGKYAGRGLTVDELLRERHECDAL